MADQKLTQLPSATLPLQATDEFYVVQFIGTTTSRSIAFSDLSTQVGGSHDLLDGSVDQDTVAHPVVQGDLIVGNATPKWDVLAIGTQNSYMRMNATDPEWRIPGSITTAGFTMNTAKMLGRSTATAGAIEEITVGANLTLTGGTLSGAGGGTGVIGTGTSLPGGPAGGDAFFLRIGSTPFEIIFLIYDATYGHWVSPVMNASCSDTDANTANIGTTAATIAGTWSHIPNYKVIYNAGLRLQMNLQARVQGTGATSTCRVRGAIAETAQDNTAITVTETLTGVLRATGDTNFKQVISGWQQFNTSPTLDHAMTLLQGISDTVASTVVSIRAYQLRWVSA